MNTPKIKTLFRKHKNGSLSAEEKIWLESWYLDYARSQKIDVDPVELDERLDQVWKNLLLHTDKASVPFGYFKRSLLLLLGAAACLVLVVQLGLYLNRSESNPLVPAAGRPASAKEEPREIHRAFLTLSDGTEIDLNKTDSGSLANEGGTEVFKTKDGELHYKPEYNTTRSVHSPGAAVFHQISTPLASQYMVRLPDDTRVWLNTGSSIRFPTKFPNDARTVEIRGEAYFEVSKFFVNGKKIPFFVKAGQQTVEVLGTRFNVNSYTDEAAIRTTLVEGSIRVNFKNADNRQILLRPGQQLEYMSGGEAASQNHQKKLKITQVNTDAAVAWKNGYFKFDHISLEELMRQICRWYNVEVVYESDIEKHEFVGEIERTAPLSEVLAILEVGDLYFKLDKEKIIVSKGRPNMR